ncbi:MAG: hypothetical protein JST64_12365 [Actinobacteria bacterium]|nr:hypothetical protein [Actinomycetota bacterium]
MLEHNGAVFKRVTWFGIGAAAGATGVVWAQQKIRQRIDAMGPEHLVVAAGTQARKVSRQVGRTVSGAVAEGRSAMREREDDLVARRDGRRRGSRPEPGWPTASPPPHRTRPARW